MEKGKYYIGDLCYVIKGDNWDEVCSLTYPYTGKNVHKQVEGEFFLEDGRQFCIFSTLYGDGVYYSSDGDEIGVDSGTIGCVKVDDVDDVEGLKLGAGVDFDGTFHPSSKHGLLRFGPRFTVNTEDEYEEECA